MTNHMIPHRQCRVSRCIVVIQDPWVVGKKFGSFPLNFFTQPVQYFQIVNLVDCLSSWYNFIMNNPSYIKKKFSNIVLTRDFDRRNFFLVMENWQSSIVHFAASFQGRISSPVMTQSKLSSCLSKRSWENMTRLCFCSSVSSFGTIFAHTFLMSKSSVKIFLTVSLSVFTCYSMLLTVSRWFSLTIWQIFAMFSSILLVAGPPDLSSSVTLSLPSEKRFTPL